MVHLGPPSPYRHTGFRMHKILKNTKLKEQSKANFNSIEVTKEIRLDTHTNREREDWKKEPVEFKSIGCLDRNLVRTVDRKYFIFSKNSQHFRKIANIRKSTNFIEKAQKNQRDPNGDIGGERGNWKIPFKSHTARRFEDQS